jgi:hypothetical protein
MAKKGKETQLKDGKMKRKAYERELAELEVELVKLQGWIKNKGLKVAVIFEGRDSAGKGAPSNASPAGPAHALSGLWRCQRQPRRKRRNGISSVISPTCLRRARWCSSIEAGTTGPGWNGSWASAPMKNTPNL